MLTKPRSAAPAAVQSPFIKSRQFCSYIEKRTRVWSVMTLYIPRNDDHYIHVPDDKLNKATPPGFRWITIHPNGDKESPGVPIMIKESSAEPGNYYVVGGAGGKMNHLKLTGIKSKEEYKEDQKVKSKEKREKIQQERKDLIESGQFDAKKAFDEAIESEAAGKESDRIKKFLDQAAPMLGMDKADLSWRPSQEDLGDVPIGSPAYKMLEYHALQKLESAVRQKIRSQKERMLKDDTERVKAGIDVLNLTKEHSTNTVLGAITDKPKTEDRIKDLDRKIDNAKTLGNEDQITALEAERDGENEKLDSYNKIIDSDRPTVDDLAGKKPKGGKGYNQESKSQAIEGMLANGELDWQKLAGEAKSDDRGASSVAAIDRLAEDLEDMVLEDGTVVPAPHKLIRRDMQERHELLKDAAEASKAGDYRTAFEKAKRAEKIVTDWDARADRASSKDDPQKSLMASAIAIVQMRNTASQVSKATTRGATEMDTDEIKRAQVEGEQLKRLMALEKETDAVKHATKRRTDEMKESGRESGYQVDDEAIVDKFHIDDIPSKDFLAAAEKDLATQRMAALNSALLEQVEESPELMSQLDIDKAGLQRAVAQHISAGAYTAFANATLLASGDVLADRRVVDAFGVKGASSLIAAHLRSTIDPDAYQSLIDGLESYHSEVGTDQAADALNYADDAYAKAKGIQFGDMEDATDAIQAQYLNDKRRSVLEGALHRVGTTIGSLRANAELINALKNTPAATDKSAKWATLDLGGKDTEGVLQTMASLGVPRDLYGIQSRDVDTGGSRPKRVYSVNIHPSAIGRIVGSDLSDADVAAAAESQQIKRGLRDEQDWLPEGIARRSKASFESVAPSAPKFAITPDFAGLPADAGAVRSHVADIIGSRVADGEDIEQIQADMRSASWRAEHVDPHTGGAGGMDLFGDTVGNPDLPEHVDAAIDQEIPQFDGSVQWNADSYKQFKATREKAAQKLAEDFRTKQGLSTDTIHGQSIDMDADGDDAIEAAHRALAANPAAILTAKAPMDLTAKDKNALRSHWWKNLSPEQKDASQAAKAKDQARKDAEKAPDTLSVDMFGDMQDFGGDPRMKQAYAPDDEIEVDDWQGKKVKVNAQAWQAEKKRALSGGADMYSDPENDMGEQGIPEASARHAWDRYLQAHGNNQDLAYRSVLESLKGDFNQHFAANFAKASGKTLKQSKTSFSMPQAHQVGLISAEHFAAALDQMRNPEKSEQARVGQGASGKFQTGARKEIADAGMRVKAEDQRSLLADTDAAKGEKAAMRTTLGDRTEGQLNRLLGGMAQNWDAKSGPIKMFSVSMSDPPGAPEKFVKQQRAIKLIGHQKKVGLWLGAGSGKSITSLGAFTHGHMNGDHHRGLFAVPSQVQAQFGGEALRFLDPTTRRLGGKQGWKWFSKPGASREERHAAYKDPDTDFMVLTHEGLRDDTLGAIAEHRGMPMSTVGEWFNGLSREERAKTVADAYEHKGWKGLDYLYVDEAHEIVNRKGKANSSMANVMDAIGDNAKTHILGSGTPVKNDASEAFDYLSKLDPQRFNDRESFMRQYGSNTQTHKDALQRLGQRYFYQEKVAPDSEAKAVPSQVKLSDVQRTKYTAVQSAFNALKVEREKAKEQGRDIDPKLLTDTLRLLSPNSFKDLAADQHLTKAKQLLPAIGTIRDAAFNRVINGGSFEDNAKMQHVAKLAAQYKAQGKPGIVFARNLETVDNLAEGLRKQGHRVTVLKGTMTGQAKDDARRAFAPESGKEEDARADIMVLSDAGNTGLNLQRGKWIAHIDQPYTAPTLEQRNARIHRLGQADDVDVHELISDTQYDGTAERRLERKSLTSHVWQDPSHGLDDTGLAAHVNKAYLQRTGQVGYRTQAIGGANAGARRVVKQDARKKAQSALSERKRQSALGRTLRTDGGKALGHVTLTQEDTPRTASQKLTAQYKDRVPVKHWSQLEGMLKEAIGERAGMSATDWQEHLNGVSKDFHAHINETFPVTDEAERKRR